MATILDFPNPDRDMEAATTLAVFTDRACAGHFSGAIVVGVAEDGPAFQIALGDASTGALLAALGALDIIRGRIISVIETERGVDGN